MDDLSPVNRPLTITELADAFRMPSARLRRLAERHRIRPACRIGRISVYGPVQVRRLCAALEAETPSVPA